MNERGGCSVEAVGKRRWVRGGEDGGKEGNRPSTERRAGALRARRESEAIKDGALGPHSEEFGRRKWGTLLCLVLAWVIQMCV